MYICVNNLYKSYISGDSKIIANNNINFSINEGEFVIVIGASGSGKTTLLSILGCMEKADEGEILIDGKNIIKFSEKEAVNFRRYNVGFVFQFYNLISNLNVLENIQLASQLINAKDESKHILELVGLKDRMYHFPSQLSGGQQQRVAIARALAKKPTLLLCDEPTGALDYNTGKQILSLLYETCKKQNTTTIVITHNKALVSMADRIIEIKDGRIINNSLNNKPQNIFDISW